MLKFMVPLFRHFGHLNYTTFHAELIATFFPFFGRLCKGYRNISFRFFAFTFALDQKNRSQCLTFSVKRCIIKYIRMVLILILLARFGVITSDHLSDLFTLISVLVTIHNTFNGFIFGGGLMVVFFVMVGMGTFGVTKTDCE